MANTANALAPDVMPMMSGLASGLRAMLWKIAPDRPSAAPTTRPVRALGSRSCVDDEVGRPVPAAEQRPTTSRTGIGKSPSDSETQNVTKHDDREDDDHQQRSCLPSRPRLAVMT